MPYSLLEYFSGSQVTISMGKLKFGISLKTTIEIKFNLA
jgi:hypothetical protein